MTDSYIYDEKVGIDGEISNLIDWAYRYDSDYTDEALSEISKEAKAHGFPYEQYIIPVLVVKGRNRNDKTLPYEQMKIDKLLGGKISYSETKEYGEVEILEEGDKVLLSITGNDETGFFIAANSYPVKEFMEGEENFLESAVGETLFYGKVYEEDYA